MLYLKKGFPPKTKDEQELATFAFSLIVSFYSSHTTKEPFRFYDMEEVFGCLRSVVGVSVGWKTGLPVDDSGLWERLWRLIERTRSVSWEHVPVTLMTEKELGENL